MNNRKNKIIGAVMTIVMAVIMVGASELLSEKEIIFPEIMALAVGSFMAPSFVWNVSKIRMIVLITVCAVIGVLIVIFMPLPLWIQVSTAFLIVQIIYVFSRTTFAPAISAMVLPVLLQTRSIVYPVAAFVLTAFIVSVLHVLEKTGVKDKREYIQLPLPEKKDITDMIMRVLCVTVLVFLSVKSGMKFCIAPPLLVAFTEFTKPECKARKKPFASVITVTVCALSGAVCRMFINIYLGLPLTAASAAAVIVIICYIYKVKLYLPPAGAMTVLAMLIPENSVIIYPIEVFAGISVMMCLALLLFKNKRSINQT